MREKQKEKGKGKLKMEIEMEKEKAKEKGKGKGKMDTLRLTPAADLGIKDNQPFPYGLIRSTASIRRTSTTTTTCRRRKLPSWAWLPVLR